MSLGQQVIFQLPQNYIMWFARKGFPEGKLGEMLKSIYEIKLNGLDHLLVPDTNDKEY